MLAAQTACARTASSTLPYLLTCTGMVMMSATSSPSLGVSARSSAPCAAAPAPAMILQLGSGVIGGVLGASFCSTRNSFLIRRRKREFGLYNILGMGKRSIGAHPALGDADERGAVAAAAGWRWASCLSKLASCCWSNLLRGSVTFTFTISVSALSAIRRLLFAAIFALLVLLTSAAQVRLSSPAELMRSESAGEKPPRANYALGVLGAALLAAAYYLAVSIQAAAGGAGDGSLWPSSWSSSPPICCSSPAPLCCAALLQKNKRYLLSRRATSYPSSSMAYRMKRNGAGLASICILATMVLVTISSTTCLYFGSEEPAARPLSARCKYRSAGGCA